MKAEKKLPILKCVIYLVLAAAFAAADRAAGPKPAFHLLFMIFGVLTAAGVLTIVLGLLKPKGGRGKSLVSLLSSLIRYAAAIVILCWGLTLLGVDMTAVLAALGVVALIIGFGAESLVADVVTGLFMLFENQYNVGDIVEVNGFRGTVKEIGIRTTSIVDSGDNIKILNNSDMRNILNRSDIASRAVCDIGIPYATDLEALEAKLPALTEQILAAHPEVFHAAPRYLGVQELGDSAVVLRFVADVAEKDIYSGGRILNRDLWLGFRRLGVECPFPQMDVHADR